MAIPKIETLKFLIVDDFPALRGMVVATLKSLGAQNVEQAGDGDVALKMMETTNYDLVMSDWNMPNMSGLELAKKIKTNPKTAGTVVVMITAEAKKESIVAAVQAGADGYILKPFNAASLEEKLHKALIKAKKI